MPKVIVDHNGASQDKNGNMVSYSQGVEVDLPQEVVDALGDRAVPVTQVAKEEKAQAQKEVKDKKDRQVKSGETVTK